MVHLQKDKFTLMQNVFDVLDKFIGNIYYEKAKHGFQLIWQPNKSCFLPIFCGFCFPSMVVVCGVRSLEDIRHQKAVTRVGLSDAAFKEERLSSNMNLENSFS